MAVASRLNLEEWRDNPFFITYCGFVAFGRGRGWGWGKYQERAAECVSGALRIYEERGRTVNDLMADFDWYLGEGCGVAG